ncbi:MAG: hypothetical protein IPN74_02475 [Haliscomenobacter sp.]|nr:hypothetical protein [Haliscomenobacter sp.]
MLQVEPLGKSRRQRCRIDAPLLLGVSLDEGFVYAQGHFAQRHFLKIGGNAIEAWLALFRRKPI